MWIMLLTISANKKEKNVSGENCNVIQGSLRSTVISNCYHSCTEIGRNLKVNLHAKFTSMGYRAASISYKSRQYGI